MRELFVATRNRGKLKEFHALLNGVVDRVVSPFDVPDFPEVIEDGATFRANAVKKAQAAAAFTGLPALADDSGLEVDALQGRPGVLSARFAGEGAGDADNNAKLLNELAHVPDGRRAAAFRCVLALCLPGGGCSTFDGELGGEILRAPRGTEGFGYDPLFLVPEYGMTLAELPLDVKNRLSHRGRALERLKDFLSAS